MKENKKLLNVISALLVIPFFIVIFVLLNVLNIKVDGEKLLPIVLYCPIIIGVILAFIIKKKIDIHGALIILLIMVSCFFYYDTYYVDHYAWGALRPYFYWIGTSIITYITSFIYAGRLNGFKKIIIYALASIIFFLISIWTGLWS